MEVKGEMMMRKKVQEREEKGKLARRRARIGRGERKVKEKRKEEMVRGTVRDREREIIV